MVQLNPRASSIRNKKFLIWNFMKELFEMYDEACRKGSPTAFKIRDFKSTRLPIFTPGEPFIIETLIEYEKARGFIRIWDGIVTPTSKGLLQAKKTQSDWD